MKLQSIVSCPIADFLNTFAYRTENCMKDIGQSCMPRHVEGKLLDIMYLKKSILFIWIE